MFHLSIRQYSWQWASTRNDKKTHDLPLKLSLNWNLKAIVCCKDEENMTNPTYISVKSLEVLSNWGFLSSCQICWIYTDKEVLQMAMDTSHRKEILILAQRKYLPVQRYQVMSSPGVNFQDFPVSWGTEVRCQVMLATGAWCGGC